MAAGKTILAGQFLPSVDEAKEQKDHEALNLLSRYYLACHAKKSKGKPLDGDMLSQAWQVTQAVFALGDAKKEDREEALRRAVELAPEAGQNTLARQIEARLRLYEERRPLRIPKAR